MRYLKLLFKAPLFLWSKIFNYDELVILESNALPSICLKKYEVSEYSDSQLIEGIYINLGRKGHIDKYIIDSRLKHGLDFYTLTDNGQIVASTWVLSNVPRFIDEVAVTIVPNKNFYWIRDIYVVDAHRGHNVFSQFIWLIVNRNQSNNELMLLSDVSRSNKSSMHAHIKLGFKEIMSIKYVMLFGVILLRSYNKYSFIVAYKPCHNFIFMGHEFKQFIKNNIA